MAEFAAKMGLSPSAQHGGLKMLPKDFRCYLVTQEADGRFAGQLARRSLEELPPGDVLVRVLYSSLNYKDALAATGHPGVNKVFPHIPGVDAAGTVASSGVYEFVDDDPVIVAGFDMGSNRWGGFAEYVRVPQDWVVPLPYGLTIRESMILGTAGLTAALAVDTLEKHEITPDRGDVVVTGASGGVGCVAVALLAKLGYQVMAVTGKPVAHEFLRQLGAKEILGREAVDDASGKPLLSGRWAGAVDVVGGTTLSTLLRTTRHGGCVAACGLTGGPQFSLTVYPFILRGVTLAGIDAAWLSVALRHELWDRLADEWKLDNLEAIAHFVSLADLPSQIDKILAGQQMGRTVIRIAEQQTEG
jgi:putative YhdH/YhfP family quinone oxidoreductase